LRVLHVIPTLDQAGAEKQLALLACGLDRRAFDVHVCALTRLGPMAGPLRDAGIDVACVEKAWKVDPAAYWRLRKAIRRLAPDLVQTWLFAANSYGRQAARSAGVRRIVASERCVDPWKSWHQLAIDRHLARFSDRMVTNSSGVRDFYAGHGIPADRFTIIPNGVALPSDGEPVESRSDWIAALQGELRCREDLPANVRFIGAIGRLWPQKRHKDMIWASDLIAVIDKNVHVLVLGDGPEHERLERFAEKIESVPRVHFLGHRADAARFLPHFDLFWNASGYEGQSNGMMEAMARGIPVVASDIPGNRDLITHGETGCLFPVGDRAKFARHSLELLNDPERARAIGRAGRERIGREFSIEAMVGRYEALYRELE